jgi:hypothetical protein
LAVGADGVAEVVSFLDADFTDFGLPDQLREVDDGDR